MIILNLGCGSKVSSHNDVVNIDWSVKLRLKKNRLLKWGAQALLNNQRLEQFNRLPENIMLHDLSKGIPYESSSIDVVYHSHLLEHLDKNIAESFMVEVYRVLKKDAIHRVVVPDFELLCRQYIENIDSRNNLDKPFDNRHHEELISKIIEQSVRREAYGTSQQSYFRRTLENLLLGDARQRGETHQWMYDFINLEALGMKVGFSKATLASESISNISNWGMYKLDVGVDGQALNPNSLYMEFIK